MNNPLAPLSFRNDINGLRAYAVIAVLLFHFNIAGFSSGFFGVDIFFVISGFLMTAIVTSGLSNKSFNLFNFYLGRVRRIFPALLLMLLILLIIGWFWLPRPDYKLLGRQAIHAIFFISNIRFNNEAGYFDTDSHEKWTLHTWTLGVEFQFYILLPLLLMLLWKLKPNFKVLFSGLLIFFFASLLLSIYYSAINPSYAFYLLPTRAWEFIAGGLIYLISVFFPKKSFESSRVFIIGVGFIAASFFVINPTLSWPSAWALLPVTGTALIILSRQETNPLTAHPIAQWLGDRSYSIYLWHWPIVVFLYFANLQSQVTWICLGVGLSLFLGHLSFSLVEELSRQKLVRYKAKNQIYIIFGFLAIVASCAATIKSVNFNGRLSEKIEFIASESENKSQFSKTCFHANNKSNTPNDCSYNNLENYIYLVGDSHADAVFTALASVAEANGYNTSYLIRGSCPTILGAQMKGVDCLKFNQAVFSKLNNLKDDNPVVIINRLSSYLFGGNEDPEHKQGKPQIYFDTKFYNSNNIAFRQEVESAYLKSICSLTTQRPVYLLRPTPEFIVNIPKVMARSLIFNQGFEAKISLTDYHYRHKFTWSLQDLAVKECGAKILNPLPYLCDDEHCYGTKEGRPIYFDDDHLSEYGNKLLIPMFEQIFTNTTSLMVKEYN